MQNCFAVILAGGSGTRFWPKSRQKSPKQLCKIGNPDKTMIELTCERLDGFIPPERRMIVTHVDQLEATKAVVGGLCKYFIAEPEAKNTAAALAVAALAIQKLTNNPDEIMVSLHADHTIQDLDRFKQTILQATKVASKNFLTLIGMVPQFPETGFGYIEMGSKLANLAAEGEGYQVEKFEEKPNLEKAKQYCSTKKHLWNSGIFVWKVSTFLKELETYLPQTVSILSEAQNSIGIFTKANAKEIAPYYAKLVKIAIDNSLLEVSKNVAVVPGDFGWQDIGSWSALNLTFPADRFGNLTFGPSLLLETKNSIVDTDSLFVATLGCDELVVVVSKGAVLVCPKNRSQDVKKIVEMLQTSGQTQLT